MSHHWDAHPHVRTGDQLLFRERAADILKRGFGTWTALGLVALVITIYMLTQAALGKSAFDPYPYILLNLALSCLAAVQGIVLQISANRGDRISSEVAMGTHRNSQELLAMNKQQLEILHELRELREAVTTDRQARDGGERGR